MCFLTRAEKALFEPILADGSYLPVSILGSGSYGTVAKAFCHLTQRHVAIKRMSGFTGSEYKLVQALREIELMQKLAEKKDGNLHIPDIYDVFVHEEEEEEHGVGGGCSQREMTVFIVMELFDTDLAKFMEK